MLKIKSVFNIKLLVVVLCMLSYSKIYAKDLSVSSTNPCRGLTQQYEINFDNVGKIEWIIEGGIIISADANGPEIPIESLASSRILGQQYENGRGPNNLATVEWDKTGSYTKVSFDGSGYMTATFYTHDGYQLTKSTPWDKKSPNLDNFLKKITVQWDAGGGYKRLTCHADGLGAFGFISGKSGTWSEQINLPSPIPTNFSLIASKTNPFCNEGVQISGAPGGGTSYNWNTSGGVIQNNWNNGIYIDRFTRDGVVPITVTVSNQCYSVTKSITLNVTQPDFRHVTQIQNGNPIEVDVTGNLVSLDCQGSFNLAMPWVSNYAVYTWELPGTDYDPQTNTYTKTIQSGVNKLNVQGQLPTGGLTDFVGKVTITGVCGAPVVRTFIIRPALRPTVDPEIYSCTNSVVIRVTNPTGTTNVTQWSAYSSPYGLPNPTFTNFTPTSALFTASTAGMYNVTIRLNGAGGCNTVLYTTVHAQSAGPNTTAGASGWQSGVLSDNRKAVGSNIVPYGGNIYFSGRDGKIYYYSFSAALQKWVINEIPGITNAAIPAAGAFAKIGLAAIGGVSYLYYTENVTGKLWKIDFTTNVVTPGFIPSINASDFIAMGNDIYAIQKNTNALVHNAVTINNNLGTVILKAIIPGYGITYIQNNNLYSTWYGQLTYSGDVYASSDITFYNGFLYFVRGQKGSANLYRVPMPNPSPAEQITTSSNLSGIFNVNPASGVIYYGVMNLGAANTIYTQTSGSYKAADVYQAHLSGSAWIFNKATTVVNYEGLDMLIHSAVYSGNHLYYVGAGHNTATGGSLRELEVWNLYYENACAPTLQRVGADLEAETDATEVLVYPNPFNVELSIDLTAYAEDDNLTSVGVEVADAAGKTIYKATVLSELIAISTTDWAQGLYVVKISHNNTVINKKVVKY